MATLLVNGTQSKICFLTDILCDSPPKWHYVTKSGGKSTIEFRNIDDAEVMRAMHKRLQTRKDLGLF